MRNGFVTNFTMKIDGLTCAKSNRENCGGEGLAFVIHQDYPDAFGGSGANIGYGQIPTAIAVEFDTNPNSVTSDPNPKKKRHISIIKKSMTAELIDTPGKGQTIAWQDLPFNFNNPQEEGYMGEVNVRIEYFAKMFRVYLNGAL